MAPDTCPNCGAEVPRGAKACPECGSDEQTGWSEQARVDDLGLPDQNFEYQEYVEREFGGSERGSRKVQWFWLVIAVGVLAAFILLYFG